MKQQMLELYFKKKSPKAEKAREKTEPKPEDNKEQMFMGARNSPLLGEPNQLAELAKEGEKKDLRLPRPASALEGQINCSK